MRASYRWVALTYLGLWLALAYQMTNQQKRAGREDMLVLLAAIALMLPDLGKHIQNKMHQREMFFAIDRDLLKPLASAVTPEEVVLFAPSGNDFLANYLAPALNVRAFNVGGDKNVEAASKSWPPTIVQAATKPIDGMFSKRILNALLSGDVDVVILPKFDMLWGAHYWPIEHSKGKALSSHVEFLKSQPFLAVEEQDHLVIVRLSDQDGIFSDEKVSSMCLPDRCIEEQDFNPGKYPSQVGTIQNGVLYTDERRGYLLFGPYNYIRAGSYCIRIDADLDRAAGAYIDIASDNGATVLAKFPLKVGSDRSSLEKMLLSLDEPAQRLELRIFVESDTKLALRSVQLKPTSSEITCAD
ncbi:hypothetical protein HY26_16695 [Hyphomonas sp. GM-8P]|nr:hypothetical protein HY26_16695 [Hyphomonas sp. GM-8P]